MMPPIRLAAIAAMVPLALAAGCSRSDDASVLGHWRAERMQVYSVKLPLGPDVVISKDSITSPGVDAKIPLDGIERKGDEAVLDTSYGMGISLYFASPDRVYLNVPIIGKVYYRRVDDSPVGTTDVATATAQHAVQAVVPAGPSVITPAARPAEVRQVSAAAPVASNDTAQGLMQQAEAALRAGEGAQAEKLLSEAQTSPSAHPLVDYDLAVLAAERSDSDSAIDHLNQAFKHGYRQFATLDATPEFEALRRDVRYQALVARYR
ncbi:hypothetical protein AB4Y42_35110 [Paraburkholderia sp. EG286B]|uniref:TPR end-of-group domain-containing protein n=1 Tax=Paraburkholderia sp. EG286B TaxID=3237011 RepID=UPI0034D30968